MTEWVSGWVGEWGNKGVSERVSSECSYWHDLRVTVRVAKAYSINRGKDWNTTLEDKCSFNWVFITTILAPRELPSHWMFRRQTPEGYSLQQKNIFRAKRCWGVCSCRLWPKLPRLRSPVRRAVFHWLTSPRDLQQVRQSKRWRLQERARGRLEEQCLSPR